MHPVFTICHRSHLTNVLDLNQTDINLKTTVFAGKISGVGKMSKYSDDEFVEFIPVSDITPENKKVKQEINKSNDMTSKIDMTRQNQQPVDPAEEETNIYTRDMFPNEDSATFQIRYAILRDQLPTIIVFHCSGKLVESNCLILHNTFKMCSIKNLPFIIFDMTDVSAVEKEVWVYFSSKVSKLQKLNGILLFAGIRSEVLSETTDFNKLNICHCDTVTTCCLAIRNLTQEHEKTDNCKIFDEDDSSVETQSNIHDFLYNARPASELPEMKLVDSFLNINKNEMRSEKLEEDKKESVNSSTQPPSKPDFSPFEKTILINDDGSNPIADAKRKVMAELNDDIVNGLANAENKEAVSSPCQPQSKTDFSAFEQTILINDDGSNPIADAKRKVMAELTGDIKSGKTDQKSKVIVDVSVQTHPDPEFSSFDKTVLINDDGSNPIADAKRRIMNELAKEKHDKKDTGTEMSEVNSKDSCLSSAQSQPEPDFSPFEKTILINKNESNPTVDTKRKVMSELNGDMQSENVTVENKGTVVSPIQSHPELFPIEKVNLNSPGLFEKTILLDENNGNPILDAKKRILEELGKSQKTVERRKNQVESEKVKENREQPLTSHSEISSFEKTVLFNDSGVNPIAEIKKNVMQEMAKDGSLESGADILKNKGSKIWEESKEKVDSSTQSQPKSSSQSQYKPKTKPVVSDKSQTLSLKDLYIDDSMSTDYSVVKKNKELPSGDTDEILPLVDESQSIDFSPNDKTVMSQSATVDISKTSLGLTKTSMHASLKNISPSDPYSVHYGVYEKNAEEQNKALPFGKTINEKLTVRDLIFKVIADYGPVNILQIKNHINKKLDKKDRINTLKLFALLRQFDLDTHEKRVRYYRSC
jgi:hypothetical protein